MRRTFLRYLACAALGLCLRPGVAATPSPAERTDALLRQRIQPTDPGAVVAVLRNGAVRYVRAVGVADTAAGTRLTQHSTFDLASCSKQFTAMAIMQLAERKVLAFEDDARKLLPELPVYDTARPIRINDLLHHTSGLPDYTAFMDHLEQQTNLDVLKAVAGRKLEFRTGSKFHYSNTNYALLALIVERASHQPFGAFLQKGIFGPLGMQETVLLDRPDQVVKNRAQGYTRGKQGYELARYDTRIVGDGQVMTSVGDLGLWDKALRRNTLVRSATLARAFTSGTLDDGKKTGYGYGWSVGKDGNRRLVDHDGEWAGTNTYILRYLDGGLTVIVLSNVDNFGADKLGDRIAALWLRRD